MKLLWLAPTAGRSKRRHRKIEHWRRKNPKKSCKKIKKGSRKYSNIDMKILNSWTAVQFHCSNFCLSHKYLNSKLIMAGVSNCLTPNEFLIKYYRYSFFLCFCFWNDNFRAICDPCSCLRICMHSSSILLYQGRHLSAPPN